MHGSAWSLVPFLTVIPISMWTKQVVPGLAAGLLAGAYMTHPTPLGGVTAAIHYMIQELTIADNLRLILFLYGFGALVGLVRVSGGIAGFARWLQQRITTTRGAFAITWLSALATFMAPDFRIITVAPIMQGVFARLQVPAQRVAMVIDITATPLTSIIPIGTAFVGYMVGLMAVANRHHTVARSPFQLFLASIPWNLFAWLMLATGLVFTFWPKRRGGEMGKSSSAEAEGVGAANRQTSPHPRAASSRTAAYASEIASELSAQPTAEESYPDAVELVAERVQPHASHLLIPLGLLLTLTLFFTWWSGRAGATGLFSALAQANAALAMLQALLVTLVLTVLFYAWKRQPIARTMFGFMGGGNDMMGVIVLLSLVWAVTAASADLGFVSFTEREVAHLVPPAFIAPVLFVSGCVISYVIGSSFGTWGMLLPLGFSLAASTHASIPLVAGAVFASGTFGGFVSPLSDNTVAMATVMRLPLMTYSHAKLKLALPAVGLSALAYSVVGWFTAQP